MSLAFSGIIFGSIILYPRKIELFIEAYIRFFRQSPLLAYLAFVLVHTCLIVLLCPVTIFTFIGVYIFV